MEYFEHLGNITINIFKCDFVKNDTHYKLNEEFIYQFKSQELTKENKEFLESKKLNII